MSSKAVGTCFISLSFLLTLSVQALGPLTRISNTMGQTIASTQFFVYGKKHFTKTGYQKHVKSYYTIQPQERPDILVNAPGSDNISLAGKTVCVTGANSGLGKEVSTYVVAKGGHLIMLCRNMERATKARDDIIAQIKQNNNSSSSGDKNIDDSIGKVDIVIVDVGELEQVRKAVDEIATRTKKVDVLVCNAGVLLNEKQVTSEGNEATFASHLLGGSYLLSQLLKPLLLKAPKGRVIFVTSGGMYNFGLPNWDTMTSFNKQVEYNGVNVYAYAKRGQVVLAERESRESADIEWVTVHPGWSDTPAVDEAFGDQKKYLQPLREPWQGAEGVAWLVGTDESLENGGLYLDRKIQPKHMAGPFFSQGTFTKNSDIEIDEFMANMKKAAGL